MSRSCCLFIQARILQGGGGGGGAFFIHALTPQNEPEPAIKRLKLSSDAPANRKKAALANKPPAKPTAKPSIRSTMAKPPAKATFNTTKPKSAVAAKPPAAARSARGGVGVKAGGVGVKAGGVGVKAGVKAASKGTTEGGKTGKQKRSAWDLKGRLQVGMCVACF